MSALIDTLTTAPAGSRELDARVGEALGWKKQSFSAGRWYLPDDVAKAKRSKKAIPPYRAVLLPWFTTDLNATFAEAQRRGWRIMVDSGNTISGFAKVYKADDDAPEWIAAATPALAACAALIAAVEAG